MTPAFNPSEVIEYERYRQKCSRAVAPSAPLIPSARRVEWERNHSFDAFVAVGFRSAAEPGDVADAFLRQALKERRPSAPRAPFDVVHGLWLSQAMEEGLRDLAAEVRSAFLDYMPCEADGAGVYVRWTVRGDRAMKIGQTGDLLVRSRQAGRLALSGVHAWLPFGGTSLERACLKALKRFRAVGHPEGREVFDAPAADVMQVVLSKAIEYLRRQKGRVDRATALDRSVDGKHPWEVVTAHLDNKWTKALTVGSSKDSVLMLRAKIERLRANGHDWNDVAELLKDDGQGGGIAINGATIKAALAEFRTTPPNSGASDRLQVGTLGRLVAVRSAQDLSGVHNAYFRSLKARAPQRTIPIPGAPVPSEPSREV